MKYIEFRYGVLCDDLEKQANEKGYTLKNADLCEMLRKSINVLKVHRISTDIQTDMMFRRLHKRVVDSLEPLEKKNERTKSEKAES